MSERTLAWIERAIMNRPDDWTVQNTAIPSLTERVTQQDVVNAIEHALAAAERRGAERALDWAWVNSSQDWCEADKTPDDYTRSGLAALFPEETHGTHHSGGTNG